MSVYLAFRFAKTSKDLAALNIELEDRVARRTSQLKKANEELRELDKMKSSFVNQASHDLRTPLTAIKGSLDNLGFGIAGQLNEKQKKIVARATKSVERLGNLVNDLLDLSRIESGRIVLEKSHIPFISLIENIIGENKPAADQKQIQLTTDFCNEAVTMNLDGGKIERVVGELIGNAIKYTPEGGTVNITLLICGLADFPDLHSLNHITEQEKETGNREWAVLSVRDSGIGMTQEECQKIWERFYRTNASKMMAKGSGLGLSIAKELVELHGGTITAESDKGKGTVFSMILPMEEGKPQSQHD
ncbi:hypothetical protein GF373_05680 [bacterium]|nr:hypothetical protein [bacterium]